MWGMGFFKGMAVTMRNAFRGPITLRYPEQREVLPERARWALSQKRDAEGRPKCTACQICVGACPDCVITLDFTKSEDGSKHIDSYVYEIGACMFCGLCVESCPYDAIEMSHEYELAVVHESGLFRRLLEDVEAAPIPRRSAEDRAAAATTPAGEASGDA